MDKRFQSYTCGEARTGVGQCVMFQCPPNERDNVRKFLEEYLRKIEVAETGQVNVEHGGRGKYTRYNMTQHKYAGGGSGGVCGYNEILEIHEPPDGRCGIVFLAYQSNRGYTFWEWDSLEHALAAWEVGGVYSPERNVERFAKLEGMLRHVPCGYLDPWFYATGHQLLTGDYAFPEDFADDPVFKIGRRFVVFPNGCPVIKTCMGTLRLTRKRDRHPYDEYMERIVHWHDGTTWTDEEHGEKPPRPLEKGETWIAEAVEQFQELLAGMRDTITIDFLNGMRFSGAIKGARRRRRFTRAGEYYTVLQVKGETGQRKGYFDFTPTPEAPDAVTFLRQQVRKQGQEITHLKIEHRQKPASRNGAKVWTGVFHEPPNNR